MCLAFLHGETIVFGILLLGGLFWPSALALFIWKWRYLSQHKLQIIVGYLLLVAVSCLLLLSYDSDVFGFIFGTALTLPWSLLLPQFPGEDFAFAASLFLCGVINSALFYLGARLLQKSHARNVT